MTAKRIIFLLFIVAVCDFGFSGEPQKLEQKNFKVCGVNLSLEIADNHSEREIGLMHRSSVPSGTGMIFVFEKEQILSFWMKNVPMDIDIGYFNKKGELVSSYTMKGTSPVVRVDQLPSYPSLKPAKYAVEAEAGFYSKKLTQNHCKLRPLP